MSELNKPADLSIVINQPFDAELYTKNFNAAVANLNEQRIDISFPNTDFSMGIPVRQPIVSNNVPGQ